MLKKSRVFLSAALVAVLFASTLILTSPNRAKACPPPPPATLLELFLRSDKIVIADVKSEKDGKIISDEEDYFSVEVVRNLRVQTILKGNAPKNMILNQTEYRDKKTADEAGAEVGAAEETIEYFPYGYRGSSKIERGERYLFFFAVNDETKQLELTDEVSAVKKLNDSELNLYQKRLAELKKITETKEDQLDALTDWLVRLIEEPATRWDGVADLTASFEMLEYEKDSADEASVAEAFVIDEDFSAGTSAIAKNLTDSQRENISSIYFGAGENIFNQTDEFYYSLSSLVARWDKSRILAYAYGVLQAAGENDAEKNARLMNYISTIVADERLSEIASLYGEADAETDAEPMSAENSESEKNEIVIAENEIKPADEAIDENQSNIVVKTEPTERQEEQQPKKLTVAEKRKNSLGDFKNRYEYLLARNFVVETETAEDVGK